MKRYPTLDIAKGFGILLVVLGHGYSADNPFYYWIGSFHMPLFFIVTGILYGIRSKEYRSSNFPWRRKLSSILVPYLTWAVITQAFLGLLKVIGGAAPTEVFTSAFFQIIRGNAGFLWFLPALFLAELLFYLFSSDRLRLIGAVLLGGFGLLFPTLPLVPDYDSRVLLAFFFITAGYFGHTILLAPAKPFWFIVCACVSVGLGVANGEVILPGGQLGNPILLLITSFCGSYLTIQVSQQISRHTSKAASVFSWLGQNSIIILCVHNILTETIRLADYKTIGILPTAGIFEGFLVAGLTMAAMVPIIFLGNRYLYWSFGKKKPLTPAK